MATPKYTRKGDATRVAGFDIRAWRIARGYTMEEAQYLLQVGRAGMLEWEWGYRSVPRHVMITIGFVDLIRTMCSLPGGMDIAIQAIQIMDAGNTPRHPPRKGERRLSRQALRHTTGQSPSLQSQNLGTTMAALERRLRKVSEGQPLL